MAIIVSERSGNWEDGTTWVGGGVPTQSDDVTITDGHRVITTADVVFSGTLTIGTEDTTTTLQVGDIVNKLKSNLILSGATVQGVGRLGVTCGHLKGTNGAWSVVSVRAVIRDVVSHKAWSGWILESITFKGSGVLNFSTGYNKYVGVTGDVEYSVNNCVFKDCAKVTFMARGVAVPKALKGIKNFERVSVINCPLVQFANDTVSEFNIKNSLMLGNTITANNSSLIRITNSAYIRCFPWSWNNVEVNDCYFGTNVTQTPKAVGNTALNGTFNRIIAYGSPDGVNSRIVTQDNVTNSFIEDLGTGGSNSVLGGSAGTLGVNWTNNILLGTGDGFTSMLGAGDGRDFSFNCSNNTMYVSYYAANNERYSPPETVTLNYKNNLYVCVGSNPRPFLFNQNGMPSPINIDLDYNYGYNVSKWTGSTSADNNKYVNVSGEHNVIEESKDFPRFVDPTRNHDTYAQKIGGTDYNDVWSHLYAITGYDPVTEQHSNPQNLSVISDMYEWLVEGYTPQNMELATAGEGGTYVGAVMPKEAPSGLKVVFNGVTMSRAFFNGQPIALDKIKFLQS